MSLTLSTGASWQTSLCIFCSFLKPVWLMAWSHPNFTIPKYKDIDPAEIRDAVYKHKIVPDVIPRVPRHYVQASHAFKNSTPRLGNILNPNPLDCFPFQLQWPTENGTYYTLMMIDPDYPSRDNHSLGAFQHWLIGNIPDSGEDYPMPDIFNCTQMTRYLGPMPAKGTGFHRYTFLVYKQRGKVRFKEPDLFIEPDDPKQMQMRMHFSAQKFSAKYKLGKAYAIGFYLAEWIQPPPSTTYAPWDFTPETEGTDVGDWSMDDDDEDVKT